MNTATRTATSLFVGAFMLAACTAALAKDGDEGRHGRGQGHGREHAPGQAKLEGQGPGRWLDNQHGHNRYYPAPGHVVKTLPTHVHLIPWRGVNYRYWDGLWYTGGPHGYVTVHAPFGAIVRAAPSFYTVVTLGGLAYLYANGVYYREHRSGGYEVVEPPAQASAVAPIKEDKLYVYPRNGQNAQQQASDEYECHRWAATQTGYDPSAAATGQAAGDAKGRLEYPRARSACLEARGYAVK
jgi:Family of unknown function (DUF6515)